MEKCTCYPCGTCGGRGFLWLDAYGHLSNIHPMDDMATMEECDSCYGDGTEDYCEYCREQDEE